MQDALDRTSENSGHSGCALELFLGVKNMTKSALTGQAQLKLLTSPILETEAPGLVPSVCPMKLPET